MEVGSYDVEAFEVAGQTDQIPFKAHFVMAPQREAPEFHRLFDDSEDGFGALFQLLDRAPL